MFTETIGHQNYTRSFHQNPSTRFANKRILANFKKRIQAIVK